MQVSVRPASGTSGVSEEIQVAMTDRGDGTYVATYSAPSRGNYYVSVEVDGLPIEGSPFPVYFAPAPAGGATAEGSVSAAAAAGTAGTATLAAGPPGAAPASSAHAGGLPPLPAPPPGPPPLSSPTAAATVAAGAASVNMPSLLANDMLARTVYASNINPLVSTDQLRQLFSFNGTVSTVIMSQPPANDAGAGAEAAAAALGPMALITFSTAAEAQSAMAMNGKQDDLVGSYLNNFKLPQLL